LGSVLAQDVLEYNFSSKFKIFAINDEFLTHASREELIKLTALDEQTIINKIKEDFK